MFYCFFYTPAFYDFLVLLSDTVNVDASLRGNNLMKALHFKGVREGVSGKYSVKVSDKGVRSCSFPISIYKVTNQGITVEDTINF